MVGEATTEGREGAPGDRRGGNAVIDSSVRDQARLVQALARSLRTGGRGIGVRILETHISYVSTPRRLWSGTSAGCLGRKRGSPRRSAGNPFRCTAVDDDDGIAARLILVNVLASPTH